MRFEQIILYFFAVCCFGIAAVGLALAGNLRGLADRAAKRHDERVRTGTRVPGWNSETPAQARLLGALYGLPMLAIAIFCIVRAS
jgi:hypothetical protein